MVLAGFDLSQEVLAVELVDLLNVAEDDVLLASQRLGHVGLAQLGDVVVDDVLQRLDVVTLRLDYLRHYQGQRSIITNKTGNKQTLFYNYCTL